MLFKHILNGVTEVCTKWDFSSEQSSMVFSLKPQKTSLRFLICLLRLEKPKRVPVLKWVESKSLSCLLLMILELYFEMQTWRLPFCLLCGYGGSSSWRRAGDGLAKLSRLALRVISWCTGMIKSTYFEHTIICFSGIWSLLPWCFGES